MPNAERGRLEDPDRLAALAETGLLDTPVEEIFDRHTRLAGRLLGVPVSLVSLVAGDHQFRKSQYYAPGHTPAERRNPLSDSFCQHVVAREAPLVVPDSLHDPLVRDNGVADVVRAYLGIPITLASGQTIGSFCAIDAQPHEWSGDDVALLRDIAAGVIAEIELRVQLTRRERLHEEMQRWLAFDHLLAEATTRFIDAGPANMRPRVESALGVVARGLDVEWGALWLPGAGGWAAAEPIAAAAAAESTALPWQDAQQFLDLVRRRLEEQDAIVVEDSDATSGDELHDLLRRDGVRASALLPVLRDGELAGILCMQGRSPRGWPEHKLLLLRMLGDAMLGGLARAAAEAQLEKARATADAAVRAKERFLADISHELRTPLNGVIGISHLLAETELDERQGEYLRGIRYSANLLLALTNDLLDLARITAGRLHFAAEPFNVRTTIADAVGSMRYEAERKNLYLDVHIDDGVPATLDGDAVRLTQVLMNLVGNALRFTERGGVSVAVQAVAPAPSPDRVVLRLDVTDSGVGIAADRLDGIFEAFVQEKGDTARLFGGSGLGLTIVRELVEAQGGTVAVRSTAGQGSTFTVQIPLARHVPRTEAPAAEHAAVDLRGVRILVVDDNELNLMVTQRTLVSAGVSVATAQDGEEALALLRTMTFDVVLMDLQMPRMDGFEAAWRIRSELGLSSRDLPILALSASARLDERQKVDAAGMDELIMKPYEPGMLKRRIAAHLGDRTAGAGGSRTAAAAAPLDVRRLELSTLGDAAFARRLAAVFDRSTPQLLDQLAAADPEDVAALAHKLKSGAGVIGAVALQQAAEAIEVAAEAGSSALTAEQQERLRVLFAAASAALARYFVDNEAGEHGEA
jgi:signal transduction histidine kinase/CheY-like chemotaxis protein/HPt (histidine-containing phosphotransfer) domain-containing protein